MVCGWILSGQASLSLSFSLSLSHTHTHTLTHTAGMGQNCWVGVQPGPACWVRSCVGSPGDPPRCKEGSWSCPSQVRAAASHLGPGSWGTRMGALPGRELPAHSGIPVRLHVGPRIPGNGSDAA